MLMTGVPGATGTLLLTLSSPGLVGVFVDIVRRQPDLFTIAMGLGVLVWFVGNGLWVAGRLLLRAVPW